MTRKLGKLPARHDPRTLPLRKFLRLLPIAPPALDLAADAALPWGTMLNSELGCCTCSAPGHLTQAWTGNAGNPFTPPDADILAMYEGACGYDPTDPTTDQGGVELDVMKWWTKNGIGTRPPLGAFAKVNRGYQQEVCSAAAMFEGLYIGLQLPLTARPQTVWDVVDQNLQGDSTPGSWGGHAVCVVGYDSHFVYVVTWGEVVAMTWPFWFAYVDEAYALISQDELDGQGKNKNNLDWEYLQVALNDVTG